MGRFPKNLFVSLILIMTILVTAIHPVGARWVRLGNGSYVGNLELICRNGFNISIAFTFDDPTDLENLEADIDVFAVASSPPVAIGAYPEAALLGLPHIAQGLLTINENGGAVIGLPPQDEIPDNGEAPDQPTTAIFYGSAAIPWLPSFTPTVGSNVSVIGVFGDLGGTFLLGTGTVEDCENSIPGFADGRANRFDTQASVVPYCNADSLDIYKVNDQSKGDLVLRVSLEDIKSLGQSAENTLIASADDIRLYLLSSGELQINAPGLPPDTWKEYVFTWGGCG